MVLLLNARCPRPSLSIWCIRRAPLGSPPSPCAPEPTLSPAPPPATTVSLVENARHSARPSLWPCGLSQGRAPGEPLPNCLGQGPLRTPQDSEAPPGSGGASLGTLQPLSLTSTPEVKSPVQAAKKEAKEPKKVTPRPQPPGPGLRGQGPHARTGDRHSSPS